MTPDTKDANAQLNLNSQDRHAGTLAIQGLKRQRQEDNLELKVTLFYIMNSQYYIARLPKKQEKKLSLYGRKCFLFLGRQRT